MLQGNQGPTSRRSFSSLLLGMSNISETLLPLIRGIVLARLLPPDQFGLAVTVTIVASIAELVSELGVNQLALRSGVGESLGTLHSLAAIRGCALGLVITLAGPFFAWVFNTPETAWIYSLAGFASFVKGFCHLEPKARMRQYQYAQEAASILGGQVIWTVACIAVAFVLPDYRAMVIGLIASAVGNLVISHLLATTPFRLRWDRSTVSEAMTYGRPLVLNGIALSVAGLGDRFLIGWKVGLGQLAHYSALASAAFLPRSAATKFLTSLFTPQFVNATDPTDQRRLSDIWVLTLTTLGGGFGLVFIACGQQVVGIAFGHKYIIDQPLINLVGFLACIRYMATMPLAPSMALGRTKVVLANTTSAATGLLLGAVLLLRYQSLDALVGAMIVGEGLSLLWIVGRLTRFVRFTPIVLWTAVLLPYILMIAISAVVDLSGSMTMLERWGLCAIGILALLTINYALLKISGSGLMEVYHRLFPRHHPAAAPIAS